MNIGIYFSYNKQSVEVVFVHNHTIVPGVPIVFLHLCWQSDGSKLQVQIHEHALICQHFFA